MLLAEFDALQAASLQYLLPTPNGLTEGETAYSIKLNHMGEDFLVVKQATQPVVQVAPGVVRLLFLVPATSNSVWNTLNVGTTVFNTSFQISRPPEVTSIPPIELPAGVVIDLSNSGVGAVGRQFAKIATAPAVVILFGPNGNVVSVNHFGFYEVPTSTIHFLVGTRDGFEPDEAVPAGLPFSSLVPAINPVNKNLTSLSSKWVSIAPITGTVASEDNSWRFFGEDISNPFNPPHYFAPSMLEARSLVVRMKSEGGN